MHYIIHEVEPAICNGHLPYPWVWHWREGMVGSYLQGVGVGGAKCLGEGRYEGSDVIQDGGGSSKMAGVD